MVRLKKISGILSLITILGANPAEVKAKKRTPVGTVELEQTAFYSYNLVRRGTRKFSFSSQAKIYEETLNQIEAKRKEFSSQYQLARGTERAKILAQSQQYVQDRILNQILPAWDGVGWILGKEAMTSWDRRYIENCHQRKNPYSNQTSSWTDDVCTNCSLYVADVLKDAGFRFTRGGRTGIAAQNSLNIIQTFAEKKDIKWLSNNKKGGKTTLLEFTERIKESGEGIYIVGLDMHTGFIVYGKPDNKPKDVYFCNAAYYTNANYVMCESAVNSGLLNSSRTKVVGKILSDNMMESWIESRYISTVLSKKNQN